VKEDENGYREVDFKISNSEEEDIANTYRLKIIFSPGLRIGYILFVY
jgi:hypothetical protein